MSSYIKRWIESERGHMINRLSDEFRGITILQILSTFALSCIIVLNLYLNSRAFYDHLIPVVHVLLILTSLVSVSAGILLSLAVLHKRIMLFAGIACIAVFLIATEMMRSMLGLYLAISSIPGVVGSYGIWSRSFPSVAAGFLGSVLASFSYQNPFETPVAPLTAYAIFLLIYVETGHIAIAFTRVKARVLEYQHASTVFVNFYNRVIRRYLLSLLTVLCATAMLLGALLHLNVILRTTGVTPLTESVEVNSFIGVSVTAIIAFILLTLVRTVLPR